MMTMKFKGSHFERDVILWGMRWYVAYPIGYRQIEEMMGERGVEVDHSTLHRWVLKYVPALEKAFLARKRLVGGSWRLDETYVRVKSAWKYLYRRHSKYAGNRFAHEVAPALESFANSSPQGFIAGVKAARETILARNDEDRQKFLKNQGFSKGDCTRIIETVLREEGHLPESVPARSAFNVRGS
jgi:hypothetical protein